VALGVGGQRHPLGRSAKQDALACEAGADAQRDHQMGLAGARRAYLQALDDTREQRAHLAQVVIDDRLAALKARQRDQLAHPLARQLRISPQQAVDLVLERIQLRVCRRPQVLRRLARAQRRAHRIARQPAPAHKLLESTRPPRSAPGATRPTAPSTNPFLPRSTPTAKRGSTSPSDTSASTREGSDFDRRRRISFSQRRHWSWVSSRATLLSSTRGGLVGLLAATGLGVGEALRLDRHDIDASAGVLLVRRSKSGNPARWRCSQACWTRSSATPTAASRSIRIRRREGVFVSLRVTRVIYADVRIDRRAGLPSDARPSRLAPVPDHQPPLLTPPGRPYAQPRVRRLGHISEDTALRPALTGAHEVRTLSTPISPKVLPGGRVRPQMSPSASPRPRAGTSRWRDEPLGKPSRRGEWRTRGPDCDRSTGVEIGEVGRERPAVRAGPAGPARTVRCQGRRVWPALSS